MTIRSIATALALGLAGISQPASAGPDAATAISEADMATIDSMADKLFGELRAGDVEAAYHDFFASSKLAMAKPTAFEKAIAQTRGTLDIYGPIVACEQVDSSGVGSFVHYRTYVCQHTDFLTSWQLAFFKTSGGWIGANLHFTDQPTEP